MNLYLVRHAESELNVTGHIQDSTAKLSTTGLKQAKILAGRFKTIPIDTILSSDAKRTMQTAKEIASVAKKEVKIDKLLREIKMPARFQGRHVSDPEFQAYKEEFVRHADESNWHYEDEENFYEMKERASEFLAHMEKRADRVLAVTHGRFLRLIVLVMLFGTDLEYAVRHKFNEHFSVSNTGITLCRYSKEKGWEIITWNDHAHLG